MSLGCLLQQGATLAPLSAEGSGEFSRCCFYEKWVIYGSFSSHKQGASGELLKPSSCLVLCDFTQNLRKSPWVAGGYYQHFWRLRHLNGSQASQGREYLKAGSCLNGNYISNFGLTQITIWSRNSSIEGN